MFQFIFINIVAKDLMTNPRHLSYSGTLKIYKKLNRETYLFIFYFHAFSFTNFCCFLQNSLFPRYFQVPSMRAVPQTQHRYVLTAPVNR